MRGEDERARAEEAGQPVHADLPHLGPFLLASVSTYLSRPLLAKASGSVLTACVVAARLIVDEGHEVLCDDYAQKKTNFYIVRALPL